MSDVLSPQWQSPHGDLLESYEAAIRELRRLRDPKLAELLRRLERRHAELADVHAMAKRHPAS